MTPKDRRKEGDKKEGCRCVGCFYKGLAGPGPERCKQQKTIHDIGVCVCVYMFCHPFVIINSKSKPLLRRPQGEGPQCSLICTQGT